jgi:uncharacterized membrane protein
LAAEGFWVYLLATAGGGGEAYDMCFFCPAFVGVVAIALVAFVGLAHGATRTSVVAVLMSGIIGVVVLLAMVTTPPTDDPDEQGSQQMLGSLLWWWVAVAVISVASAMIVAARKCASRRSVFGWFKKKIKPRSYEKLAYQLLYLCKPGGFSVQEWEQALADTPNTRVIQLSDTLVDVGDKQVWVSYGGPGAEVRLAYDPQVLVRSGDTHFWSTCFFYKDGFVYFQLFDPHPDNPVQVIALRFSELLGTRIEDKDGREQTL